MGTVGDDQLVSGAPPPPATGLSTTRDVPGEATQRRWSQYSTVWAEYAQDIVSAAVAVTLVGLAGALLVAGIVSFFTTNRHLGLTLDATDLLDQVLLVLILVEIVHTVVLSLQAHALSAQPFIVVGLVAVIRKILFALGSAQKLSAATLGLYIAMVGVFVASLVAIEVIGRRRARRAPSEVAPDALMP